MAFPYEIKDRLVAQGVGTYGDNIFIGQKAVIPDGDGPYLSIIETGGGGASRTQNQTATEHPTGQLVARGTSHSAARTMLQSAYDALGGADGLHNITLSGVPYLSIVPRQGIGEIGLDELGRSMLSFNIEAEKQPS